MESTRRAISAAGVAGTPRAVVLLALAAKIDDGDEQGSSLAAIIREFRVMLAEVESLAAPVADDPIEAAKHDLRIVS